MPIKALKQSITLKWNHFTVLHNFSNTVVRYKWALTHTLSIYTLSRITLSKVSFSDLLGNAFPRNLNAFLSKFLIFTLSKLTLLKVYG